MYWPLREQARSHRVLWSMSVLWLMKIQCGACSDSSGAATGGRCPSSCSAFDFDFDLDLDLCAPLNHAGRSEGTPSLGEVPSGGAKPFWLLFWRLKKVTRCKSGTASSRYRRNGYAHKPPHQKKRRPPFGKAPSLKSTAHQAFWQYQSSRPINPNNCSKLTNRL